MPFSITSFRLLKLAKQIADGNFRNYLFWELNRFPTFFVNVLADWLLGYSASPNDLCYLKPETDKSSLSFITCFRAYERSGYFDSVYVQPNLSCVNENLAKENELTVSEIIF